MVWTAVWQDALSGLLFWLIPLIGAWWQRETLKEWLLLKKEQHQVERLQVQQIKLHYVQALSQPDPPPPTPIRPVKPS